MKSKIEWTDYVWNPVIGCRKVSRGCWYCYAERMANRLLAMGVKEYDGLLNDGFWNGTVRLLEDRLDEPLHWKKPRRVFVDSMSDLFHEDVPGEFIQKVYEVMGKTPQHTYLILTKRPERMQVFFMANYRLRNVWLGVSVENQQTAEVRIPYLLRTPAAVRFVSCEPLLGFVDLTDIRCRDGFHWDALRGFQWQDGYNDYQAGTNKLDWVIVGGESGVCARPMHPDWVTSLRDQCQAASVPFYFKQWGEWAPAVTSDERYDYTFPNGVKMVRVGKRKAGRMLDGRIWDEYPGDNCGY